METSEEISAPETVLITGGGGYLGCRLGSTLQKMGRKVILFDIHSPSEEVPDTVSFIKGDICNYLEVEAALRDVDCIFHLASYGMSGREHLNVKLIEDVNLKGTDNVIKACLMNGIPRLLYTSTYNVVFGGQVIENGDESLPYLPLHLHPDHYSRTKSLAEMKVLHANSTKLRKGTGVLRTCALRPAGIYGPGEQRHLTRIVNYTENGLFKFVYGAADSLVEFVHVDNLVSAEILASEALKGGRNYIAAGQAYFISDGKPVNNFEFFKPLVEGLGYKYPTIRLPLRLIYYFAFLTEIIHFFVGRIYNFQPFLTRTEVYEKGVTHYFSIQKARKDLGYHPKEHSFMEIVEWFKARGHGRKSSRFNIRRLMSDVIFLLLLSLVIMSWLPVVSA